MDKIIKRRPLYTNIELPDTLHPIIKRLLAARGINDISELDYGLQNLLPYSSLLGIDTAVDLLYEALTQQARILIVADYDVDGATSCVLAMKALQQMGATKVGFLVPNREKHGYGLTPAIVELALKDDFPDLLITVDNGISSIAGVEAAKKQGMRVLITDHHLPSDEIPNADAIVNPKQQGDTFPSKNLCGVGVIFYVMMALRARLREKGWFNQTRLPEPNLADLLDLVALGTVADVVTLDYNNRILVEQGLRRIRANRCSPGIRALIEVSGRDQNSLISSDLGFYLAPRINAAGRMDDMSYGIACLLSDNDLNATQHARLLQTFNQERRLEETKMQDEALETLDTIIEKQDNLPIGLCLLDEKWHQGVIGILAARIKDRLNRPVIIFTYDKDNQIRGSARSVQGVHIRDILDSIASQHPEMINRFGGHAMAAGLTIPRNQFQAFQKTFDTEVRKYLSAEDLHGILYSDGPLSGEDFNLELAEQLQTIPWGHNFHEPIFDGKFELLDHRLLKEKHLKMQVRPIDGGPKLEVIAFNTVDTDWPPEVTNITLAYKLDINRYRGATNLQLMAKYLAVDSDLPPST